MKIDKELCERFMATLPKQEIAFDGEQVVAMGPHWLSSMITQVLEDEDRSCEVLTSFVRSNMPLFKAYTNIICDQYKDSEMDSQLTRELFMQEVIIIFCFFVIKFAFDSKGE